MDAGQREALNQAVRSAVAADLDAIQSAVASNLDALHVEVHQLRRELTSVRAAAGLAPPQAQRREKAAELRSTGLSTRLIASALDVHRATVLADLKAAAAPRPDRIVGLDGRTTRGPRPPLNGSPPAT